MWDSFSGTNWARESDELEIITSFNTLICVLRILFHMRLRASSGTNSRQPNAD